MTESRAYLEKSALALFSQSIEGMTNQDLSELVQKMDRNARQIETNSTPPETEFVIKDGVLEKVRVKGNTDEVVIPEGVRQIASRAFPSRGKHARAKNRIKHLVLPTSLRAIESFGFARLAGLESLTIPNGVKFIGDRALSECTSLRRVTLPSEQCRLGESIFYSCTALESVCLPKDIESIPLKMFTFCHNLKTIKIPDTVKSICKFAFWKCNSLESVELPDGLKEIKESAFESCSKIKHIQLPHSLSEIEACAFSDCASLQEIDLSTTRITQLSPAAFNRCLSLKQITFPPAVGKHFVGTSNRVCYGHSSFSGCVSIESIKLPYGMTEIPNGMFSGCISLKSIQIPPTVKKIGIGAFENCGFEVCNIPDSITEIGDAAFRGCDKLQIAVCPSRILLTRGRAAFRTFPRGARERKDCDRIILTWSQT